MTPQRIHSFLRPAIAAPGQQAISIEHCSDHFIRTDSRQDSHGISPTTGKMGGPDRGLLIGM
jgi:hypothetical protein